MIAYAWNSSITLGNLRQMDCEFIVRLYRWTVSSKTTMDRQQKTKMEEVRPEMRQWMMTHCEGKRAYMVPPRWQKSGMASFKFLETDTQSTEDSPWLTIWFITPQFYDVKVIYNQWNCTFNFDCGSFPELVMWSPALWEFWVEAVSHSCQSAMQSQRETIGTPRWYCVAKLQLV